MFWKKKEKIEPRNISDWCVYTFELSKRQKEFKVMRELLKTAEIFNEMNAECVCNDTLNNLVNYIKFSIRNSRTENSIKNTKDENTNIGH